MNLDELTADELAEIDSVCLDFEASIKAGNPLSIDRALELYLESRRATPRHDLLQLLTEELQAIQSELAARNESRPVPPAASTPFQSKTEASPPVNSVLPKAGRAATSAGPESAGPESADSSETETPADSSHKPSASDTAVTQWAPSPSPPPDAASDSQTPTSNSSAPVYSIGPYSIGDVLARGGMGTVYRATDTRLDRPVAIKMMGFSTLAVNDPKRVDLVDRFEREAKSVAALSHPNIVELFDVGVSGGVPYAVMEFLDGHTLSHCLSSGAMSPEQTRQVGMQIAGALATAHAGGVIHRDLKPQNIMVVQDSKTADDDAIRVKLVDFGLSRVDDAVLAENGSGSGKTRVGAILGTPGYMAPEQARGEPATTAADMFGFGCVLYETFYGTPAIPGDTPADRLAQTLKGEVVYPESECSYAGLLCGLIKDCLQKTPDDRPSATNAYGRLRQFELKQQARGSSASIDNIADRSGEGMLRRQAVTTLGGGLLGAVFGGLSIGRSAMGMESIESIAVLRFDSPGGISTKADGSPIADRMLTPGDALASALVSELSAIDGLRVVPYRPQQAADSRAFQELGAQWDVEAFLTGSIDRATTDQDQYWLLDWQIVGAKDGQVLGEGTFKTPYKIDGGELMAQSQLAAKVAKRIGRTLVTTGEKSVSPNPMSYGCMVKGHAYADADSTMGLRKALACYSKAHLEDPERAEPLAAIAFVSLTLAARSDREQSLELVQDATSKMQEALRKDARSVNALVTQAMLEWQQFTDFESAFRKFEALNQNHAYNWKVQHQRGLLLATLGMEQDAIDAMRRAERLNPMSMLIKTDRGRIEWFFGLESKVIRDMQRYHEQAQPDPSSKRLIAGLLIDIFESRSDWSRAASFQNSIKPDLVDKREYFAGRQQTLETLPYGLFGPTVNQAIYDLRQQASADPGRLGALHDSGSTLFPLLLSRHPAFWDMRQLDDAKSYLPTEDATRLRVSSV